MSIKFVCFRKGGRPFTTYRDRVWTVANIRDGFFTPLIDGMTKYVLGRFADQLRSPEIQGLYFNLDLYRAIEHLKLKHSAAYGDDVRAMLVAPVERLEAIEKLAADIAGEVHLMTRPEAIVWCDADGTPAVEEELQSDCGGESEDDPLRTAREKFRQFAAPGPDYLGTLLLWCDEREGMWPANAEPDELRGLPAIAAWRMRALGIGVHGPDGLTNIRERMHAIWTDLIKATNRLRNILNVFEGAPPTSNSFFVEMKHAVDEGVSITGANSANKTALFPNGEPGDRNYVEFILNYLTKRGHDQSDNQIAREYTDETVADWPKAKKLLARMRMDVNRGNLNLPH
jgi:hypothetical protein